MRADVSDEAEKDRTGEAEEDVPKRTVIEDGSTKPNGIASRGALGEGSAQLELPMSSGAGGAEDRLADRARAIIDSLDKLSSEEVFAAFEELDQLPSDVVRAALEGSTGPAPDPDRLDDATRRAHGFPARPLRLRTVAVTKDADIFDLGPVAEQQLRLAGKAYDGRDLEPEERLDGETEDSFAGTLEHRVLVDADQPDAIPVFEVLLYAGDAGTVFRAGTTDIVGAIAYGVVEMKDRRARVAVQEALARPFEPEPPLSVLEQPAPQRAAVPRAERAAGAGEQVAQAGEEAALSEEALLAEEATPSEEATTKKVAAAAKKKSAPKKKAAAAPKKAAATKQTSAKKPSAKKASADAAVKAPKKPAAKKATAAKKPSAKKATAKKASAKKPAGE